MKNNWIYIIIFYASMALAQPYHTRQFNHHSQIPASHISKVFVNTQGIIFLGSRAGLFVKNGNIYERVKQTIPIKFNNIFDIAEDAQHNLWVAGYGQGVLCIFPNGNYRLFTKKNGLVSDYTRKIFVSSGKIYVGTQQGFSIIDLQRNHIQNYTYVREADYDFSVSGFFEWQGVVYAHTLNDGIFKILPNRLEKISDVKKVFASYVYQNQLFIATEKRLLVYHHPQKIKKSKEYAIGSIWDFLAFENQLYMVSSGLYDTKGGIYQWKKDEVTNMTERFHLNAYDLLTIAKDEKNNWLYLGTYEHGLFQVQMHQEIVHTYKGYNAIDFKKGFDKKVLLHDKGILIDHEKGKIIAISLQKFKDNIDEKIAIRNNADIKHHFFPIDFETPAEKIKFYQMQWHHDMIWVASNVGIFTIDFDGNMLNYYPIHTYYFTFFNNQLIYPVPYGGVRIFKDLESWKYDYYSEWKNKNIPENIVAIAQNEQNLYFGSALTGLYQYGGSAFTSLNFKGNFTENRIKRMTIAGDDALIIANDFNDIYKINTKNSDIKVMAKIPYDRLTGNAITALGFHKNIWYVATNEGLNVFYENRKFLIDESQGLTFSKINNLFNDQDSVYAVTENGLFSIAHDYFTKTKKLNTEVVITDIFVNGKSLPQRPFQKINLANDENFIKINLAYYGAKYADKIVIYYRIKADEKWRLADNTNQILLTHLQPGKYNLEVKIWNQDLGKGKILSLWTFQIKTPFYSSWIFIVFSVLITGLLSFLVYKWRINLLRDRQKKNEEIETLSRDKETQQLRFDKQIAEVKLQALRSQINAHFIFNVLNAIQYFVLKKDFDEALHYLEKFSQLIRKSLDLTQKEWISLEEEIQYLKEYIQLENVRRTKPIHLMVNNLSDTSLHRLGIMPLLLQPIIENAILHAFPQSIAHPTITINVETTTDQLSLEIIDNGIGIPNTAKNTERQSHGLSIVQRRLEINQTSPHQAFQMTSDAKGTRIKINLPIFQI